MAETPSTMIPLGTKAPDFTLLDTISGQQLSLHALKSDIATVIMFICNHCPYVKLIQQRLVEVANLYQTQGIRFIAINSNDAISYPQDDPFHMKQAAEQFNYPFPYLYDESQAVARAYAAACTPDFYVFDRALNCVYRGRFDNATPGNQQPVTGNDLCQALDAMLNQQMPSAEQKHSVGCNIKWKKGI